jgi:hypothetical protein
MLLILVKPLSGVSSLRRGFSSWVQSCMVQQQQPTRAAGVRQCWCRNAWAPDAAVGLGLHDWGAVGDLGAKHGGGSIAVQHHQDEIPDWMCNKYLPRTVWEMQLCMGRHAWHSQSAR